MSHLTPYNSRMSGPHPGQIGNEMVPGPPNPKKRRKNAGAANNPPPPANPINDLLPPPPVSGFGDTIIASNPFDDCPMSAMSTMSMNIRSPNNPMAMNPGMNPGLNMNSMGMCRTMGPGMVPAGAMMVMPPGMSSPMNGGPMNGPMGPNMVHPILGSPNGPMHGRLTGPMPGNPNMGPAGHGGPNNGPGGPGGMGGPNGPGPMGGGGPGVGPGPGPGVGDGGPGGNGMPPGHNNGGNGSISTCVSGVGPPHGPNSMSPMNTSPMPPGMMPNGPPPPPPNGMNGSMAPGGSNGPMNGVAPNSMHCGNNNNFIMNPMMYSKPMPVSAGKIYPADQPMVFNAQNPNAPPIYPCGVCHKEVHDNDQAILCESGCNFWFHRGCTGLTEAAFQLLTQEVYAEWVCDKCLASKNIPLVKFKP